MASKKSPLAPVEKKEGEGKKEALAAALGKIEKQYGKGAIMKLGEKSSLHVEAISTGALCLDCALGIGGLPKGRIIEIYGPESSGKTTVALHAVAEAQKKPGAEVAFIDAEPRFRPGICPEFGRGCGQFDGVPA